MRKGIGPLLVVLAATACSTIGNTPPSLPTGTETLTVGQTWAFTMYVGCGEPVFYNDTWWVVTEKAFEHPDYVTDWDVEVLNQGAVDGPDAKIQATITLVDEAHIEIRTNHGALVAIYQPGEPSFCG